jgi:S1-C subfamily serine protease
MQRDIAMIWLKIAAATLLVLSSFLAADQLTLKDGTVLEGTVITQADSYWIKTPDGKSRIIPFADVKSVNTASTPGTSTPGTSANFAATKRQADAAESPMAALAIWQKYVESKPADSDRSAAASELEKWKKLADDDAEKINGKWIGGPQRRDIMAKASALCDEAAELIARSQTLAAVKKLEQAVKVYPNSYQAIFSLGYLSLVAKNEPDAIRYFEQGLRLRPNSSEALNNLGIAVLAKRDYTRAVDLLYKAVQVEDNKVLAQNLINVLDVVPQPVKNTLRYKAAADASKLLAGKYSITAATRNYALLPPRPKGKAGDEGDLAGVRSAGSGFVIRDDGLILTNRHVVEGGQNLLVLLPGNVRKSAEVVSIDEEQDLALIRVKPDQKLPTVVLAAADSPAEGAQCFVMGYPLIDRMGATIKITQGIVSGRGRAAVGTDVVVDAKVNPGNSGGPLLNNRGQVIGIVTMKSRSTETEDSYGLAISSGRIRKFLEKHQITPTIATTPGETLDAEQVVARLKDATVCVLSVR